MAEEAAAPIRGERERERERERRQNEARDLRERCVCTRIKLLSLVHKNKSS